MLRVASLALVLGIGCGSRETSTPATGFSPAAPRGVLLDRDGALESSDLRGTRSAMDRYDVPVAAGERVRVTVTSTEFDTVLEVTPPGGAALSNDDANGDRTRSEIELLCAAPGALKVEITGFHPDSLGAYHVHVEQVPEGPTPDAVSIADTHARQHHVTANSNAGTVANQVGVPSAGETATIDLDGHVNARLETGDHTLQSGELGDAYLLQLRDATPITIELESADFDAFLLVTTPSGEELRNDDSGGTLNSRLDIEDAVAGQYRIVATTYRPGENGNYELKVTRSQRGSTGAAVASAPENIIRGELSANDTRLNTGEYFDEQSFEWAVGTSLRIEARSGDFDAYLIVKSPAGEQRDNDDSSPGVTNAGIDYLVSESGTHRVLVTSYRAGETGAYELAIARVGGGGTSPATALTTPSTPTAPGAPRVERGELREGDEALDSGELVDHYRMQFAPGAPVSVRLESSAFDPYLIVHTPSGQQNDNDDFEPGQLASGFDIAAAEAGEYVVSATSYRPGETGDYVLTVTEGGSAPSSSGTGSDQSTASSGANRVWLLSVGISDYPGGANDLPECANDAVKIAQALREQGLTTAEREILLTDARATRAAIRDAMTRMASAIQPRDTFVFFYSGHGGQASEHSNDARELDSRDEYLFVYDGEFLDNDLGQLMDSIRARTTLAAIDACFAGGFSKDIVTRPGIVGMFSSEEDVTSAVAGQFQAGGYLSHFMRLGIQGEADADPHDRALTVGELTHFVWRQYARHADNVRMSMGYQHLVVDRGAVHASQELWRGR